MTIRKKPTTYDERVRMRGYAGTLISNPYSVGGRKFVRRKIPELRREEADRVRLERNDINQKSIRRHVEKSLRVNPLSRKRIN